MTKEGIIIKKHKDYNNLHIREHIVVLLILVGTVLFSMIPNLYPGIVASSDAPFHLARIWSLADALKAGIFPVKVHPQLCYGLGYGVGFFYDNALLYIPALLILAGVSLETAYKLFILFVFVMMAFLMYHCCLRMSKNSILSAFTAALYVLSYRVAGQLYADFTLGNVFGAVFMPLAIAGIYLFVSKDQGLWMFILGFCGLLYSHAISCLLAFSACLLILLFHLPTLIRKSCKILRLIFASFLVVMVSAAYWLPMLQQFHTQTFKNAAPWTKEEDNVESVAGLIMDPRGPGIEIILVGAAAVIGLIVFTLLYWYFSRTLKLTGILHEKSDNRKNNTDPNILTISTKVAGSSGMMDYQVIFTAGENSERQENFFHAGESLLFLCLGIFYMVLPCCRGFWLLINKKFTLIQFPTRLFLPASILLLFSFVLTMADLTRLMKISKNLMSHKEISAICDHQKESVLTALKPCIIYSIAALILFAGMVSLYSDIYRNAFKKISKDILLEVETYQIAGAGAGLEWLPVDMDFDVVKERGLTTLTDQKTSIRGEKTNHCSEYTFITDNSCHYYYDVPYVYYRGYSAVDEMGRRYNVDKSDEGLVRISNISEGELIEGKHTITVRYTGTKYQQVAYSISVVGISLCILAVLITKRHA